MGINRSPTSGTSISPRTQSNRQRPQTSTDASADCLRSTISGPDGEAGTPISRNTQTGKSDIYMRLTKTWSSPRHTPYRLQESELWIQLQDMQPRLDITTVATQSLLVRKEATLFSPWSRKSKPSGRLLASLASPFYTLKAARLGGLRRASSVTKSPMISRGDWMTAVE